MGCYVFDGAVVYTRNHAMAAAMPFESGVPFMVPADEFEAAIGRMKRDPEIGFDGDAIVLKAGRLKSTITVISDTEAPGLPPPPDGWRPSPPALSAVLKTALAFTGDQGWQSGIELDGDTVTAFSSRSGIVIDIPGMACDRVLISKACAEFLAGQGAPTELAQSPGALDFRWHDGRLLHTQVLTYAMPKEIIERLFAAAGDAAPIAIDDEWRAAWLDAAALSEAVLEIAPDGFHGGKGAGRVDVEMTISLEQSTFWHAPTLVPIFDCATHWNPAAHPGLALFTAPGLRGVVQGPKKSGGNG
jgi:hypothetical protein